MNRARRRAQREERKLRLRHREWKRGVAEFRERAGGLVSVDLVRRGERHLDAVIPIARWALQARESPDATRCAGCPARIGPDGLMPYAFALIRAGDNGPVAIVSGFCRACAARDDIALLHSLDALLRAIWPDLRWLDAANVHPEAGHA